jgi:hypothetical protein
VGCQDLHVLTALLLLCSSTGCGSAQGVLADCLLMRLVVSDGLLPVQVQLLVKLAREAEGVLPR